MATNYLERLQIPEQFEEILHDLLKEILREQPKSINYFCKQYFYAKIHNKNLKDLLKQEEEKKEDAKLKRNVSIQNGIEDIPKQGIVTEYMDNIKDDLLHQKSDVSIPKGIVSNYLDRIEEQAFEENEFEQQLIFQKKQKS